MLAAKKRQGADVLAKFVKAQVPERARDLRIRVRPLRGGLVSDSVLHVSLRFEDGGGTKRKAFVVKQLDGVAEREAVIYERLLTDRLRGIGPALYGVARPGKGGTHLCLEAVVPLARWPWKDISFASAVLERASALHQTRARTDVLGGWDYARELVGCGRTTLETAESLRKQLQSDALNRSMPSLRRLQQSLPKVRAQLLRLSAMPRATVHGDLHPGNVLVRRRAGGAEPILLDWARARDGSPLEDVASWLQWLGFWEPEVRRKHDSLLGVYLSSRGLSRTPSAELRSAYWLAGALNCFSGAMTYHLSVAADEERSAEQRWSAVKAMQDCLRVVRRADAHWG